LASNGATLRVPTFVICGANRNISYNLERKRWWSNNTIITISAYLIVFKIFGVKIRSGENVWTEKNSEFFTHWILHNHATLTAPTSVIYEAKCNIS